MIQLLLLFGLAAATAFAVFRERIRPQNAAWIVLLWTVFPASLIVSAVTYRRPEIEPPQTHNAPAENPTAGYVGSQTCLSCHPNEHDTWRSSWHRTMTQKAHPSTTMTDIESLSIEHSGNTFRIDRVDDELWASFGPVSPSPKPAQMQHPLSMQGSLMQPMETHPIVMTTGSHHMQMYWMSVSDQDRRMLMFPFVYLLEQDRFVPRDSLFLKPPGKRLTMEKQWGINCMYCHTTFAQFSPDSGGQLDHFTANTQAAEFGISCEACHGPGEEHATANQNPLNRYRQHLQGEVDSNIVNPGRLDHERSSQVCGQCHSVQLDYEDALTDLLRDGIDFRPGDDLSESARWSLLRCCSGSQLDGHSAFATDEAREDLLKGYFWSDGMVRVSGREFNGLVETPCFQHGDMSCLSCHVMHQPVDDPRPRKQWANDQLKVEMVSGNAACVQCHETFADEAALTAHTHHDPKSTGSSCYNCHMTYTTYGLVKALRSHQLDSPDVATTVATGRPNACNQCHLDQTLAWAAEHLEDWYEIEPPELTHDQQSISATVLSALGGDAGERALMAWSLGWKPAQEISRTDWMVPYLAQLMMDRYPAVRLIAHRSLKSIQDYGEIPYDYVGSSRQGDAARNAVLELWLQRSASRDTPAPSVLIDRNGRIDQDLFDRLLNARDTSDVNLLE